MIKHNRMNKKEKLFIWLVSLVSLGLLGIFFSAKIGFTPLVRLYAVQALLVGLVGVNLWVYLREKSQKEFPYTKLISFVCVISVGGLLTLVGQIYAVDELWQGLLLWVVLQIPFLVALPNIANLLLWVLTINAAIICYFPKLERVESLMSLLVVNLILFGLFRIKWRLAKKIMVMSACVTLFSALAITNYLMLKYENLLQNGSPILLALVPQTANDSVKNRHYELLEQVQKALPNQGFAGRRLYALLTRQENGVMSLCRVENQPPTDFTGCESGIYLPIQIDEYWRLTLIGERAYLFQASKNRQANYAEYRFENGKALLFRLLDKQRMPL